MAKLVKRGNFKLKSPREKFTVNACIHPFTVDIYSDSVPMQFAKMKDMGMSGARVYLPIDDEGLLSTEETTQLNSIIAEANSAKIDLYPIIANGVEYGDTAEDNYTKGATMGEGFAIEYGSLFKKKYFELGNETANALTPITGDGSSISHYNAAKYELLSAYLKGYSDGIKSVNSSYKTVVDAGWKNWGFINALLADGVKIDVVAWHWYSDMEASYPGQIADQLITRFVNIGKEVWINELNSRSTDQNVQAEFISDFYDYLQPYSKFINKLFIYELFDNPAHSDPDERNYGLLTYVNDTTANFKASGNYFRNKLKYYPPVVKITPRSAPPAFTPGAYLERGILDPVTGNEIIKMSDGSLGKHHYSKTPDMNCNSSMILMGKTLYSYVNDEITLLDNDLGGWFGSNPQWSYMNPNLVRMIAQNNAYVELTLPANTRTEWPLTGWTNCTLGGNEGNFSYDEQYCVVLGTYLGSQHIGVFNTVTKTFDDIISIADAEGAGVVCDLATVTPDGQYVFLRNKISPNTAVGALDQLYDRQLNFIRALSPGSHPDFGYDMAGNVIYGHVLPTTYTILDTNVTVTPASSAIINTSFSKRGGHFSMRHVGKPGWGGVGGWGDSSEAILIKLAPADADGNQDIMRFCDMRSTGKPYAAEPKPCWNFDGTIVFFNSDMGVSGGTVHSYMCIAKRP